MKEKVLQWEIAGIVFIILVGSFLHFTFELSGYSRVIALVAAVNESVWEHLKLGFWPAVLYALIEYPFLKRKNFALAKAVSIYVIPFSIVVLFYAYTTIVGHSILFLDILIFIVAVILGQLASYKILTSRDFPEWMNASGAGAVILLAILFIVFTFYPPHVFLFEDPISGGYGIL